jgi:Leucine-rich repeat (LRR) protein
MKLLGYLPNFINQPILSKVTNCKNHKIKNNITKMFDNYGNKINLDHDKLNNDNSHHIGPNYFNFYPTIIPFTRYKIYVDVKIMDSNVEKLLNSFDNDIEELIINQLGILGLLDLGKFIKLKKLVCSSNEIMHIINLPLTLEYLDVSFNLLKMIDISYLVNLKYFRCSYNNLTDIKLPCQIEFFDCTENLLSGNFEQMEKLKNLHTFICSYNKLNKINFSKSNLNPVKKLEIDGNKFLTIENIPNTVEYLNCSYNPGINLDFGLPKGLKILNCSKCDLIKLDNLSSGLKELTCSSNQITYLDNLPCELTILFCRENNLTYLDWLPDSIEVLFVGSNRLLKSLDNLNRGLKYLECDNCPINKKY